MQDIYTLLDMLRVMSGKYWLDSIKNLQLPIQTFNAMHILKFKWLI